MKKIYLLSTVLLINVPIFAQNPFKSSIYLYGGVKTELPARLIGDFGIGFLQNTKQGNRHNSLASVGTGSAYRNYHAKYAFDISLYKKNNLQFFVSPFAQFSMYSLTFSDYKYKHTEFGVQPSLEYRIGNKIQLTAALPISLFGYQSNSSYYNGTTTVPALAYFTNIGSQLKLGARINILNKRSRKK